MSFNASIPNVTDFLTLSQKQMLANFQAISNAFSQNHIALDDEVAGQHDSLTLVAQSGDPTTTSNQAALYNKLVTVGGVTTPQLFFRSNSNATPIQMTNSNSSIISNASGYRQSSFLAGPFTIYTGLIFNATNGMTVTLLPSSVLKYIGVSIVSPGPTINLFPAIATNITANTFQLQFGILFPSPTIYYMAIGL